MQLSRVKDFFTAGAITSALVHYYPVEQGWSIEFEFRPGTYHGGEASALDTQRGKLRTFKTADSALKLLGEIGFERVTVHIPH